MEALRDLLLQLRKDPVEGGELPGQGGAAGTDGQMVLQLPALLGRQGPVQVQADPVQGFFTVTHAVHLLRPFIL